MAGLPRFARGLGRLNCDELVSPPRGFAGTAYGVTPRARPTAMGGGVGTGGTDPAPLPGRKLMMATSTQRALAAIVNVSVQAIAGGRDISRTGALPPSNT